MRLTRLLILCALSSASIAQQPVGVGGSKGVGLTSGVVQLFDWAATTPSGCTSGMAGQYCTGSNPLFGDAYYFTAWLPNSSGLPVTSGLPVVGTVNDFRLDDKCNPGAGGNIAVLQLDTFNWSAPASSRITVVNCMTSFGTSLGSTNAPAGWNNHCISGDDGGFGGSPCGWKSRVPFSKGGKLYLPVNRQIGAGNPSNHGITIMMSEDSGATWRNPYTTAYGGAARADGDAPLCGSVSSAAGALCLDEQYTDSAHSGAHSSIMFPNVLYENWQAINWGVQDGQPFPSGAGVKDGCDPNTYVCFIASSAGGQIARVPNASIQDVSAWRFYYCPTLTQNYRCDPTDSANWTATLSLATPVWYSTYSGGPWNGQGPFPNPYEVNYIPALKSYVTLGQGTDLSWAPSLMGPWKLVWRSQTVGIAYNFLAFTPALEYAVASDPTRVTITASSNNYHSDPGHPFFTQFELGIGRGSSPGTINSVVTTDEHWGADYVFEPGNVAGTFPLKGVQWAFDMLDAQWSDTWPFFMDRARFAAVLTSCEDGVGCATVLPTHGTEIANTYISEVTNGGSYAAHWRTAPADTKLDTEAVPTWMSGNSSYSVAGIYRRNGTTPFGNYGAIWSTGVETDNGQTMVSLNQTNGVISLDWGGSGVGHYRWPSAFTMAQDTWYFIAVTVSATTGCGSNCIPTVHGWVSIDGVLTDIFAGQTYTAINGGTLKTPNISAGAFYLGINPEKRDATKSAMSYATVMTYDRALSWSEVQLMYRSFIPKMRKRSIEISTVPDAPAVVTNTQAVISYNAPDSSACTFEVSESSSYSPLVNDVNTSLFAGSNSDGGGALARNFVVGKRIVDKSSGTNYSRALQAYTGHYYRRTCGSQVTTGQFTTANIPVGNTYNEPPAVDSASPGTSLQPTITGARNQTIVDPLMGSLLSPVSLIGDQVGGTSGSHGVTIYDGAGPRVCNPELHDIGGGTMGRICNLTSRVGWTNIYVIVPATGETRNLGWNTFGGEIGDDLYSYFYDAGGASGPGVYRALYTGNFVDVGSPYIAGDPTSYGATVPFGTPALYTNVSLATLIHNFDSTFVEADYTCSGSYFANAGTYSLQKCARGGQNSYGWVAVFYGGDGRVVPSSCAGGDTGCPRIVAAWNTYATNTATRYCGIHQLNLWKPGVTNGNIVGINWHGLDDWSLTDVGLAVVATTSTADVFAGGNTITVTGPPVSRATGGDPVANIPVAVGDKVSFRSTGNPDMVISSIAGNTWTFTTHFTNNIPAGNDIRMPCNVSAGTDGDWAITFWDFLHDAHATDTTGATIVSDTLFPGGGHYDVGVKGRVSEAGSGYGVYPTGGGTLMASLMQVAIDVPSSAYFAGDFSPGFGSLLTKHPSYHQLTNTDWFFDRVAFGGGDNLSGSSSGGRYYSANIGATLVSGSLYRYFSDTTYPLHRKVLATQASTGGTPLLDISSPATGNVIGTGAGDNYKYCYANVANECRTGSSAGDVYFNVPTLTYLYCTGGDAPNPFVIDICITNAPAYSGTMMQFYLGTGSVAKSRNLTGGLVPPKMMFNYPLAKSLPDESYGLFTKGTYQGSVGQIDTWKVKLPPFPAPDGVDRATFQHAVIPIATPPGLSIASAAVEFGYIEQGTVAQHYCTSRREACVAVAATVTDATPFQFATTDTYSRMSCATSCTITLPVLPSHVAYYTVKFYDGSGSFVQNGNSGLAIEGTVK